MILGAVGDLHGVVRAVERLRAVCDGAVRPEPQNLLFLRIGSDPAQLGSELDFGVALRLDPEHYPPEVARRPTSASYSTAPAQRLTKKTLENSLLLTLSLEPYVLIANRAYFAFQYFRV